MAVDEELDRLYALPLDEFTAARNELAKRLRREGDKDGAERVRGLAKPSVAAWAVNQLARRRGARVRALLEAADGLRAAQQRALGGGGGDELRSAAQRERELVGGLRRDARELLVEAGRPPTDATLERVATTISSAALDPDARPLLEAGRLSEEVATTGFDAFAGMALPAGAPALERERPSRDTAKAPARTRERPSRDEAAAERRRATEAKKRAAELRKRATALEKQAERAERAAERAAAEAERAAGEAERARAAADAARAEADEAEAQPAPS
jgi:hypothetical protein